VDLVRSVAEADSRVIDLMAEVGADLSRPTNVTHYLYFSTRHSAERAGEQLRERAFDARVGRPLLGRREWCLFASHTAVVSDSSIGLLRATMDRLAAELGGTYDGWEAMVAPEGGVS